MTAKFAHTMGWAQIFKTPGYKTSNFICSFPKNTSVGDMVKFANELGDVSSWRHVTGTISEPTSNRALFWFSSIKPALLYYFYYSSSASLRTARHITPTPSTQKLSCNSCGLLFHNHEHCPFPEASGPIPIVLQKFYTLKNYPAPDNKDKPIPSTKVLLNEAITWIEKDTDEYDKLFSRHVSTESSLSDALSVIDRHKIKESEYLNKIDQLQQLVSELNFNVTSLRSELTSKDERITTMSLIIETRETSTLDSNTSFTLPNDHATGTNITTPTSTSDHALFDQRILEFERSKTEFVDKRNSMINKYNSKKSELKNEHDKLLLHKRNLDERQVEIEKRETDLVNKQYNVKDLNDKMSLYKQQANDRYQRDLVTINELNDKLQQQQSLFEKVKIENINLRAATLSINNDTYPTTSPSTVTSYISQKNFTNNSTPENSKLKLNPINITKNDNLSSATLDFLKTPHKSQLPPPPSKINSTKSPSKSITRTKTHSSSHKATSPTTSYHKLHPPSTRTNTSKQN